jgi:hypothetical protein
MSSPTPTDLEREQAAPEVSEHHHGVEPFVIGWIDVVVAACVYEVIAEGLNAFLDEPLVPSVGMIVHRVSPRAVLRKTPAWVPTVAILGFGLTLSIAAGARRTVRSL